MWTAQVHVFRSMEHESGVLAVASWLPCGEDGAVAIAPARIMVNMCSIEGAGLFRREWRWKALKWWSGNVAGAGAPGSRNMVKMEARVSGCVEMKMMTWKNVIGSTSLVEIKPTWHVLVGQF